MQTAAGFLFPVNYPGSIQRRFRPYNAMLYSALCRILRRQDRPTAHSPAREYASPPVANRRRDTNRGRRQLTKLPRPLPQYPPLTLQYGMTRLLRCASDAACTGQWSWVPARTFDMIVLTEQGCDLTTSPASLFRRQSKRPTPYRSKVLLTY